MWLRVRIGGGGGGGGGAGGGDVLQGRLTWDRCGYFYSIRGDMIIGNSRSLHGV